MIEVCGITFIIPIPYYYLLGRNVARSPLPLNRLIEEDITIYHEQAENLASHFEDKYTSQSLQQRLAHGLPVYSEGHDSNFQVSNTQLDRILGGNVVLPAAAAPNVDDPPLFKLALRPVRSP